jgi:hypothetical protein
MFSQPIQEIYVAVEQAKNDSTIEQLSQKIEELQKKLHSANADQAWYGYSEENPQELEREIRSANSQQALQFFFLLGERLKPEHAEIINPFLDAVHGLTTHVLSFIKTGNDENITGMAGHIAAILKISIEHTCPPKLPDASQDKVLEEFNHCIDTIQHCKTRFNEGINSSNKPIDSNITSAEAPLEDLNLQ